MLIILVSLIFIGFIGYLFLIDHHFGEALEFIGLFLVIVSVVGTLVVSIMWPVQYYGHKANIAIYHAISDSVENARSNKISEIERAALANKIIEVNEILAEAKYWNGTIFGDLIPDEFAELEYLK